MAESIRQNHKQKIQTYSAGSIVKTPNTYSETGNRDVSISYHILSEKHFWKPDSLTKSKSLPGQMIGTNIKNSPDDLQKSSGEFFQTFRRIIF